MYNVLLDVYKRQWYNRMGGYYQDSNDNNVKFGEGCQFCSNDSVIKKIKHKEKIIKKL